MFSEDLHQNQYYHLCLWTKKENRILANRQMVHVRMMDGRLELYQKPLILYIVHGVEKHGRPTTRYRRESMV